jgi:hypothetical protein
MRSKRINRVCATVLAASLGALLTAGSASGAVVTIGSPLKGSFTWPAIAVRPTTYVNGTLSNPAAPLVSPVDGAVIRWRLAEGFLGGPFQLETVSPGGQGNWGSGAISAAVTPSGSSFATNLPIKKGEGIALNAAAESVLGARLSQATQNADFFEWFPPLTPTHDAAPYDNYMFHQELGFNADVLPAPTVAGISATSGTVAGGTQVTITGTDFTKVTKVSFGTTPAASYKVESEGKIVATAPAGNAGQAVRVFVTTVAGTASTGSKFTYAPKVAKPAKGKASS